MLEPFGFVFVVALVIAGAAFFAGYIAGNARRLDLLYTVEIFRSPPGGAYRQSPLVFKYKSLGDTLLAVDLAKDRADTHHIYIIPPDGLPVSWTNPRYLKEI